MWELRVEKLMVLVLTVLVLGDGRLPEVQVKSI
jgi:Sec-independent protein translocase protein TatA